MLTTFIIVASAALTVGAYIPYLRGMFAGRVRPHFFSWLVWTLLTGIGAAVQVASGAGVAALVTAMSTVGCAIVATLAFRSSGRDIRFADKVSFAGALLALTAWVVAESALGAVLLLIAVDTFGFFPTVRKSFARPHEETVSMYALNTIRFTLGLIAVGFGAPPEAWLYPAYVTVSQSLFVAFLLVRRHIVRVETASASAASA